MNLAQKAFSMLYPEKDPSRYIFNIKYSGRFSPYNGSVRYINNVYDFYLSKSWRGISEEIVLGLIQRLLQKALKTNVRSINQELYEGFIKNVHVAIPKDSIEPQLKDSFDRVNEKYFLGIVEMPNLIFGQKSFRKLGSYEYASDTITLSDVFRNIKPQDQELLDYVMFHEMLHKLHKFKTVNGRSRHHTSKFKHAERQFDNHSQIERKLTSFLRAKRLKNYFGFD
jgi:hypothetical protein